MQKVDVICPSKELVLSLGTQHSMEPRFALDKVASSLNIHKGLVSFENNSAEYML